MPSNRRVNAADGLKRDCSFSMMMMRKRITALTAKTPSKSTGGDKHQKAPQEAVLPAGLM